MHLELWSLTANTAIRCGTWLHPCGGRACGSCPGPRRSRGRLSAARGGAARTKKPPPVRSQASASWCDEPRHGDRYGGRAIPEGENSAPWAPTPKGSGWLVAEQGELRAAPGVRPVVGVGPGLVRGQHPDTPRPAHSGWSTTWAVMPSCPVAPQARRSPRLRQLRCGAVRCGAVRGTFFVRAFGWLSGASSSPSVWLPRQDGCGCGTAPGP
jgi:hypothetical protein